MFGGHFSGDVDQLLSAEDDAARRWQALGDAAELWTKRSVRRVGAREDNDEYGLIRGNVQLTGSERWGGSCGS